MPNQKIRRWGTRGRRAIVAALIALLLIVGGIVGSSHLENWQASYVTAHGQLCGSLQYAAGGLITSTANARAAEACFANARTRCHAATLSASTLGVDTGATDLLLVQPPLGLFGACQILLKVSHFGIAPISNNTQTMTCQGVALAPDSLTISGCGKLGDITLPATRGAVWGA